MTSSYIECQSDCMTMRGLAFLVLASIAPVAGGLERLPRLNSLDESDTIFRQVRADIEQAYRVSAPLPPLLLYRYNPDESETLFSIAARFLLPYSTIATINAIHTASAPITGRPLLIPNQPGLFVEQLPEDAGTQGHDSAHEISLPGVFEGWFLPGRDFTPQQRRAFFSSRFAFPVDAPRITSGFGMRRSPITGTPMLHTGIDFGGRPGAAVRAAADGHVEKVDWNPTLGFYIKIQHDEEIATIYGHLSQIAVNYGQRVRRSEPIGKMGTTGLTTGPHVHFELHESGVPVDPLLHLPNIQVP